MVSKRRLKKRPEKTAEAKDEREAEAPGPELPPEEKSGLAFPATAEEVAKLEAARLAASRAAADAAIAQSAFYRAGLEVVRDRGLSHQQYAPYKFPDGKWEIRMLRPAQALVPDDEGEE